MNFLDITAEAVLPCLVGHAKSEKRNHQMQHVLFYAKHTDKFTTPKHNLLIFQVRTNKARD